MLLNTFLTLPGSFCDFCSATAAASAPARYTLFSGSSFTASRKDWWALLNSSMAIRTLHGPLRHEDGLGTGKLRRHGIGAGSRGSKPERFLIGQVQRDHPRLGGLFLRGIPDHIRVALARQRPVGAPDLVR